MFGVGVLFRFFFCFGRKVVLEVVNVIKCFVGCFTGFVIRRGFGVLRWRFVLVLIEKLILFLGVA